MTNLDPASPRLFTEDDPIVQELARQFDSGELAPEFDTTPTIPPPEDPTGEEVTGDLDEEPDTSTPGEEVEDDQDDGADLGTPEGAEGKETDQPSDDADPDKPEQPEGVDLNELSERFYGRRMSAEEASAFLTIQRDLSTLQQRDPSKFAQVYALLNGQPLPQPQPTYQPQRQPAPQTPPATPTPPVPEYIDPDVAAVINPVVTEVSALQQQFAQIQEQQQQAEYIRLQTEQVQRSEIINTAQAEWRKSKPLSETEYAIFDNQVVQANQASGGQLLNSYVMAHNGDVAAGTRALLESQYQMNPDYRARENHAEVQRLLKEQQTQRKRTAKSTALSGGGGAKPSPATQDPPKSKEQMQEALERGIAEAMQETPQYG